MQCKLLQPDADNLVSVNKSPKIPANQKVNIDSTKFPVLNQLITHKAENKLPGDRYQIKIGSNLVSQIHILDLHQGHQTIYDQKA